MLSSAGLIGLTGCIGDGVGICVNALGMLRHDPRGLPVACVVRGALDRPTARRQPRSSGRSRTPRAALRARRSGRRRRRPRVRRRWRHRVGRPAPRPSSTPNHPLASADVDPAWTRDLEQARARGAARRPSSPAVRPSPRAPTPARCSSDRAAPICVSRADRQRLGHVRRGRHRGRRDGHDGCRTRPAGRHALDRARALADDGGGAARGLRGRAPPRRRPRGACASAPSCTSSTPSAARTRPRPWARASRRAPSSRPQGGTPRGRLIGARVRAPATGAALANGTLMHALDFDDTHPGSICHITTVVAPAALAVAGPTGASGRELVTAYVAGCETVARLGAAADGEFHRRGFHATGVCGVFGATVAAARLLSLDAARTTCGARHRRLVRARPARVPRRRVVHEAAPCRRRGAGGRRGGAAGGGRRDRPGGRLDGRYGVFATHLGDPHAAAIAAQLDDLGARWESAAMAIKPYPCCHFMHGALEALGSLDLAADDVVVDRRPRGRRGRRPDPRAGRRQAAAAHALRRQVQPAVHRRRAARARPRRRRHVHGRRASTTRRPWPSPGGCPTRPCRWPRWRTASAAPWPCARADGRTLAAVGRPPARLGGGADVGGRRARQVPRQRVAGASRRRRARARGRHPRCGRSGARSPSCRRSATTSGRTRSGVSPRTSTRAITSAMAAVPVRLQAASRQLLRAEPQRTARRHADLGHQHVGSLQPAGRGVRVGGRQGDVLA